MPRNVAKDSHKVGDDFFNEILRFLRAAVLIAAGRCTPLSPVRREECRGVFAVCHYDDAYVVRIRKLKCTQASSMNKMYMLHIRAAVAVLVHRLRDLTAATA